MVEDRNSNQWIVTAAHCFNPFKGSLPREPQTVVIVHAGDVNKLSGENMQQHRIKLDKKHVIFHPDWKGATSNPSCTDICDATLKKECEGILCDQCTTENYSGII